MRKKRHITSHKTNIDEIILDAENQNLHEVNLTDDKGSPQNVATFNMHEQLIKTLKLDKINLNNTDESGSVTHSAKEHKSTVKDHMSIKNKKVSELSSNSTQLQQLNSPMYEHNVVNFVKFQIFI